MRQTILMAFTVLCATGCATTSSNTPDDSTAKRALQTYIESHKVPSLSPTYPMSDYLKLADVKVLDKTEGGPASIPGGGRMALVDFQIHYKVLPGPFHFAEGTLAWDQLHGFVEAMYEVTGNGIDQAIQSGKFEGDHKFQALFQKHESGWRMDSVMKSLD